MRRHQLAYLAEAGWRDVLAREWDDVARECLAHWAAKRLPLVVTRQPRGEFEAGGPIALGLPAPGRWRRRRFALAVPREDVMYLDEFPTAGAALALLPAPVRGAWHGLCVNLAHAGSPARVYGSYGWQLISGLVHVRPGSDIDLWVSVSDAAQADAACACLARFSSDLLRVDGELLFGDGSAVAWREWRTWREGRVRDLLVKRIDGCSLLRSTGIPEAPAPAPTSFAEAA